jgi:acetylornithine deacetylase/succinyl-diaminopimelate desuccinylase family protein
MIDLTRDLLAIPSENPPGNHYPEARELLARHLRQLGFETQVHNDCLLSFVGERDERVLYFSGHYDVVPAQDRGQFTPVIKGKNLFGRGSSDMKSGLAAMIYAAKAVEETGVKLNGQIGLVFVPDEETVGPRGSRFLEQQGILGRKAIGMLTPEPTGGIVWNANRGALTLRISLSGKPAHVGRQFEGINAFERMVALVNKLTQLKEEVESRSTAFEIQPAAARHSILMLGGQSAGGTNFNVVPESCWFTLDRRINPEENLEAEKRRLLELIRETTNGRGEASIEILQEAPAASTPMDTSLGSALGKNILATTGKALRFEMCPGLLETRFYASRGIPAYAYGPGLLTVSHGPDEFVPIDNIVDCAAIYANTALEILTDV